MKPKEPLLAVLLNCVFLGLGHLYAGAKDKAKLIISANVFLILIVCIWAIHPTAGLAFLSGYESYGIAALVICEIVGLIIYILILVDGYKRAKRFNLENNLERRISGGKKFILIVGVIATYCGLNVYLPIALLTRAYIIQAYNLPADSMKNTLLKGDRVFVYKFAYKKSKPERGDLAVFIFPKDPSKDFIKRVIAKGGDEVEIKDGKVFINDASLDLTVIQNIFYYNRGEYGKEGQKVKVPEGQYFVLGDNSASSNDSRYWGFVPEKNFKGKAYKIYYPFNRSGPVK